MRLRRPTTSQQMDVPNTGRMLVMPDEKAPPGSVRRVTIIPSSAINMKIDGGIEDMARTRGMAWPTIPEKFALPPFLLQPQQFVGAFAAAPTGLAKTTVIIEYFDSDEVTP